MLYAYHVYWCLGQEHDRSAPRHSTETGFLHRQNGVCRETRRKKYKLTDGEVNFRTMVNTLGNQQQIGNISLSLSGSKQLFLDYFLVASK